MQRVSLVPARPGSAGLDDDRHTSVWLALFAVQHFSTLAARSAATKETKTAACTVQYKKTTTNCVNTQSCIGTSRTMEQIVECARGVAVSQETKAQTSHARTDRTQCCYDTLSTSHQRDEFRPGRVSSPQCRCRCLTHWPDAFAPAHDDVTWRKKTDTARCVLCTHVVV